MVDKSEVLFLDIETHSADELWDLDPDEFFRLGQYAWGDGDVILTHSRQEMIDQIEKASLIVGHNIISFDLTAIYGKDSIRPLELAMENRVLDTMVHANLVIPAPSTFTKRNGHTYYDARKPEKAMIWLSLDNLCYQLGLTGKIGDLKELAKKYGGFCHIALDDEEFLEYAVQDIVAVRELSGVLNGMTARSGVSWDYIWREMKIISIDSQNSRNGCLVDTELAQARVNELAQERDEIMAVLVAEYNFPTEGKSPWASNAGKEAIIQILADHGITEETRPDWPRTPKGALKLGGQDLIDLTEGTEAEDVGRALSTLKGQRGLSQLALDSTHADGRVHPSITRYQLSGRTSWSKPGITVWTARGKGAVEKAYFVADPGCVLLEADLGNADARVVAAFSGDKEFAKRFNPGVDGHELSGRLAFGDEVYDSDPKKYRQMAKACVAEGTRVLTDQGEVPIEDVTLDMKVWDGVEWVSHEGVIYKGHKEVITYAGLTATPDHIVYTEDLLEVPFGVAARDGLRIAVSGSGGHPVRTTGDYVPYKSNGSGSPSASQVRRGDVRSVWGLGVDDVPNGSRATGNTRVPGLLVGEELTTVRAFVGSGAGEGYETKVREPELGSVQRLRGSGDYVRVAEYSGGGAMDHGECGAIGPDPSVRSDRQQQGVRAGELADGYMLGEPTESPEHRISNGVQARGVAVHPINSVPEDSGGVYPGGDHRASPGDCSDEGQLEVADHRETAPVYDILNAGPRHRFTANNRLISNCGHGWNYSAGPGAIARASGLPLDVAKNFVQKMNAAYSGVIAWREDLAEEGKTGHVKNWWGRVMPVERDRAYTQSGALIGQSGTREIIADTLLAIAEDNLEVIRWLRFQVHDALVWNIPEDECWWAVDYLVDAMNHTINPPGGLEMDFPADHGPLAKNWMEAGH